MSAKWSDLKVNIWSWQVRIEINHGEKWVTCRLWIPSAWHRVCKNSICRTQHICNMHKYFSLPITATKSREHCLWLSGENKIQMTKKTWNWTFAFKLHDLSSHSSSLNSQYFKKMRVMMLISWRFFFILDDECVWTVIADSVSCPGLCPVNPSHVLSV